MKNKLATRQICFMLIAYNAVLKLLIYPAMMAEAAGRDLIFPALFDLILQTVIIWSVAFLSSKTDKTFFELIEGSLGLVTARIIYALFGLYFLFSAIIPMNEQQLLVHDAFYDTIPSLWIFLPFFFFSIYAGAKSFANAGRCADVCFPIFAVAIVLFFGMSVGQAEFTNLLPVMKQPFKTIASGTLAGLFRFSESAFLLIFLGHFKYKKGDAAKITVSYAVGGVIVVILMGIFYSIYGALTPSRTFLFNNIAVFFPAISLVGRVDLIALYVLDIAVLFAVVLHIQACVHCLALAFNFENKAVLSIAANTVLIVLTFVLNHNFSALQDAASKWFFIPALIFAYLIPVLAWALKRRER